MPSSGKHSKKDAEEVYHVEVITKARVVAATDSSSAEEDGGSAYDLTKKKKRRGTPEAKWQYYVKWAGYDSDADSWEPEENVAGCQRLLTSFWEHIGVDDKDYNVGYIAEADKQWIKREKRFFAKEYISANEQPRKQGREHKTKQTRKPSAVVSRSPATLSAKGKAKAIEIELSSSSDSGDDMPLSQIVPSKRKTIEVTSSDEESPTYASSSKVQKTSSTTRKATISVPKPLPAGKAQPIPLPLPAKKPQIATRPSKRRYNQHDSIAAGTVNIIASNSAIATKQRLSQLALNPVAPRSPTIPTLSPAGPDKSKLPSAASTKHTLSSLNFKKGASAVQSPRTSFSLPDSIAGKPHGPLTSPFLHPNI
ncbi:hypothetical protein AX14_000109 [Amanita brunnescens Koide BX004]|nr:hypothetical protein AX14_000109 [Amanita brunnescens Koide BX004]